MPLRKNEVDTQIPFLPSELLYRRVRPTDLVDGEIIPTSLNSISYGKEVKAAPSVLRGKYAKPEDALHKDCAEQKDVSDFLVYYLLVSDLPDEVRCDSGRLFSLFPFHLPEPTCGAHSVISCCIKGDISKTYVKPSSTALKNDIRVKLAKKLQKCKIS